MQGMLAGIPLDRFSVQIIMFFCMDTDAIEGSIIESDSRRKNSTIMISTQMLRVDTECFVITSRLV